MENGCFLRKEKLEIEGPFEVIGVITEVQVMMWTRLSAVSMEGSGQTETALNKKKSRPMSKGVRKREASFS